MQHTLLPAAICVLAVLLPTPAAHADPGHDHGNAVPVATGTALPRFAAVSETFELVGVLSGRQITLYLDRSADNTPVTDAQIELEIAGTRLKAEQHADTYEVVLAAAPKAGVLPIVATVTAGSEVDLLAGELDLHQEAHADGAAPASSWKKYAAWAAAAVAAVLVFTFAARQRIHTIAAAGQGRAGADL